MPHIASTTDYILLRDRRKVDRNANLPEIHDALATHSLKHVMGVSQLKSCPLPTCAQFAAWLCAAQSQLDGSWEHVMENCSTYNATIARGSFNQLAASPTRSECNAGISIGETKRQQILQACVSQYPSTLSSNTSATGHIML